MSPLCRRKTDQMLRRTMVLNTTFQVLISSQLLILGIALFVLNQAAATKQRGCRYRVKAGQIRRREPMRFLAKMRVGSRWV